MSKVDISRIRNFAILGHTGSGKTTLLDSILHKTGINDRLGSVENGSSMCDWTEEEKGHHISVWAKPFSGYYKAHNGSEFDMVILDTPGYADFTGQMLAATRAADSALITIDCTSGIEVGTQRAWRRCDKLDMPRAIAITGIHKENANFDAALNIVQELWGKRCVPLTLPGEGETVYSVLEKNDIPQELVELAAETDDTLLEKFFDGITLTKEEILLGLRGAINNGNFIPVFAVACKAELGTDEMLDNIAMMFPSPAERKIRDVEGNIINAATDAPFTGMIWRTVTDPFVGHMSYIRVLGGTLKADSEVFNATKGHKERIPSLYIINGKKQEKVTEAVAGEIVALAKLKDTETNDTLCAVGQQVHMEPIHFPQPVVVYAVEPKTRGDDDKMAGGLQRVAEEDPTISVGRNEDTHELTLSGMGDIQINIAVENMKKHSNVDVVLNTPKVPYKETITSTGEGHYKHKKQSGGRGQYGEVYLRVEPKQPDDEEWFLNQIVGGAIPSGFVPAVQKGLVEGMTKGALAGYPVVNARVALYDGSYHDVDSSEIAFKIAGARAFNEAMGKAKPVLLEPIMKVRVMIPDEYMGDVSGDLNQRRGRILGMGIEEGLQVITAEVPRSEIFSYSSQLRSLTHGRGTFEMEFERYDTVPANVAQKIIAQAKQDEENV